MPELACKKSTRLCALGGLLLLAGAAQADDFWRKKPPSAWTVDEALKVVQNSPWAHEKVVVAPLLIPKARPAGSDGGAAAADDLPPPAEAPAEPMPTSPRRGQRPSEAARRPLPPGPWTFNTAEYLVRWETAWPVAEAFQQLEALGEHASAQFQAPTPRRPADRYVVTVKTTRPAALGADIFAHLSEQQLREAARLKTSRGAVPPLETERSGVGANAAVHFFFPRIYQGRPLLREGNDTVEFQFVTKQFRLATKFRLETKLLN